MPETTSVFTERVGSAHYINIDIDRQKTARYGLNITNIQKIKRYPINLRYPRDFRDSVEALRSLPLVTMTDSVIPLREIAQVPIAERPDMIRNENAHLND